MSTHEAQRLVAAALERERQKRPAASSTPGGLAGLAVRGALAAVDADELAAAVADALGDEGRACLSRGDFRGACSVAFDALLTRAGDSAVEQLRTAWIAKVRPRR